MRQKFASGMVRDVNDDKTDYTLVMDGPMFERWAEQLTRGGRKYDKRNWLQAEGPDELSRFRESALRHFIQWFRGDTDEDHAAAVFFNVNGAEYVKERPGQKLEAVPDGTLLYMGEPVAPDQFLFAKPLSPDTRYREDCRCPLCCRERRERDDAFGW